MRFRFGDHELDTETFELREAGTSVAIEPQVFDVLAHLVEHHERVVTKEELLDEVWGDRFVSESALSSRIMAARRAVGDDGRRQSMIKTAHGRGFRFVGDVTVLDDRPDAPVTRSTGSPTPVRRAPRTRYAPGLGGAIAFQTVGEGPADLVFVPGFVSNVELQWEFPPMADFFSRLATFSRLIVFDKRGTGLSERLPGDEPLSLEERMDDVRAVMDAAGSERATLFGISEGGPMSVLFAATHPDRVERLVLVNSFAGSFLEGVAWSVDDIAHWWGTGSVYAFLAPSFAVHQQDRQFLARYERNSATPASARATVAMNAAIDVRPVLSAVDVPTLIVHRRGDQVIPFVRGEELAASIPNARFVALDGEDHLAFADADRIIDAVEAFVTGAAPATAWSRTLTTMVFVDIVDSTDQAERGGNDGRPALIDRFHALVESEVRHGRGTVVRSTDERAMATFDGPARAIRAGLAVVESCARLKLAVRVGVHTGEVDRRDDDLAGINVEVGAGVVAAAAPGEVWVTTTVRDLVAGSGLAFEPRGDHDLGGASGERALFAVH